MPAPTPRQAVTTVRFRATQRVHSATGYRTPVEINAVPARPAEGSAMFRDGGSVGTGGSNGHPDAAPGDPSPTGTAADQAATTAPESRLRRGWRIGTAVVCWASAVAFAAFAIMRLFGLERTWYLDTLIAFTPYVGLLSILLIPITVLARRWWTTGLAVATAIALVAVVAPRAFGGPNPGSGPPLHVLSSNMKIGGGDPETIVRLARIHRTDVLALEEYTPWAQHRLATAGISALFPYSAQTPMEGATGSAIFSRYPLSNTGYRPLAGGFGQEYATVAVPGALPLLIEAVHPEAPAVPSTNGIWAAGLAAQPAATPNGPVRLLIGDFNATLDHRRLRTLIGTGYRDIAAQLGDGLDTTWPYDGRPEPPIMLDHALADPRIGAISFGTAYVPGSDHKAIYVTLTLPAG
jgi:endonuclease/exonuclease/phosphatase (EEP) superfamily protein YafD